MSSALANLLTYRLHQTLSIGL